MLVLADVAIHPPKGFSQCTVEVVFDGIVSSKNQLLITFLEAAERSLPSDFRVNCEARTAWLILLHSNYHCGCLDRGCSAIYTRFM